jgi:cytochrome b6-f complex subunit 4
MSYLILLPDLEDDAFRAKLVKGMGHNLYGEPAWPNELLYVFPICILGTILSCVTLAFLFPVPVGEEADAFETPVGLLPEWYLYPLFNLIRVIPDKVLGVGSMLYLLVGLALVPFVEGLSNFQNCFRRPFGSLQFVLGMFASLWLGIGAGLPVWQALTLGCVRYAIGGFALPYDGTTLLCDGTIA